MDQSPVTVQPIDSQKDAVQPTHKPAFANDKRKILVIIGIVIVVGMFSYFKDLFIAATINGMPISRLSVIRELERNSGKQALDMLITKKLIEAEALKLKVVVNNADIDQEIQKLEEQIVSQGGTLEAALAQQGVTKEQLREQFMLQKKLEKILEEKIQVSDEDVDAYLTQSKTAVPKGSDETEFKNQIRDQLKSQKFNTEASQWIATIKAAAKIQYFVDYGKPTPDITEVPSSTQETPQNQ